MRCLAVRCPHGYCVATAIFDCQCFSMAFHRGPSTWTDSQQLGFAATVTVLFYMEINVNSVKMWFVWTKMFSAAYGGGSRARPETLSDHPGQVKMRKIEVQTGHTPTLLCLISIPPRLIVMRYQIYDFDKQTPSNKSTHLPLNVEVWIIFAWHNNHRNASPRHGLWGWYKFNNQ